MYILASSYQHYFLQTVFGYTALEKQIQQYFSKCESYLRERERERERERGGAAERERERDQLREFDVPPPNFFNRYIDFWRQFFGTICFYLDSSPPLLFWHGPLL